MSDAQRLYDLLDRMGAAPKGLAWHVAYGLYRDKGESLHPDDALAIIEHAAIVWLMGRASMRLIESRDDDGVVVGINFRGALHAGKTLADALLQAVEREVADSKPDLEIDHD